MKDCENTGTSGPVNDLIAFEELRVGPVEVATDRISAPYRLKSVTGETSETVLTYRYHEPVFHPGHAPDINLASMILVQVALNYGLFCRKIVFDGYFDDQDRIFIRRMMENTNREVLVMKFLHHNPFLTRPFDGLECSGATGTHAIIEFIGPKGSRKSLKQGLWEGSMSGHCILSSGGKDSLLSYGLLREIDKDVHPVFVNESGRHWFTALNAYREFSRTDPHTARVWCNSDRVFNHFLMKMPFIRKDFNRIRSDDYPIRMWTVAVFLFGVLPILRKRGLGRLIIGDEYDTTRRGSECGIIHYYGLYDQSRFFDNALTAYFRKKGWGVHQFSILRSLSELLIIKILSERFPGLQRMQVSCHAAHAVNGVMVPCGRCEKCIRVAGMMQALGKDPGSIGYTAAQAGHMLMQLQNVRVHQDPEDAGHLYHLLAARGILRDGSASMAFARANPPTMKLRFYRERSVLSEIPDDLRGPLMQIFLQHAEGACMKAGRQWKNMDPTLLTGSRGRDVSSVLPAGNRPLM